MRTCELFDKYRDKELKTAERSEFESHLVKCEECRARKLLLDNVVHILRSEEVRPLNLADQIARKAFQPKNTWASDVVSWLRPMPALATLAMLAVLLSSLWIISGSRQGRLYTEYEELVEELDMGHINALSQNALAQAGTGTEVELWLEQEGNSQ